MATGDKLTELDPITASEVGTKDLMYLVRVTQDESKKITLEEFEKYIESKLNSLPPFFITATPGGSSSYSDDKNIIYLNWSGGSGTYNLTLPSAADIPYRKIQIISDGTLAANDKVHVLAPVGESIDGSPNPGFYTLNKPYNGVTVWSDGTQWIVIQAKST
jgi:hypothetical protein